MENLKIAFEPFIDNNVRRFIDDGINDYNFAVTGHARVFSCQLCSALGARRGSWRIACGHLGQVAESGNALGLGDRSPAGTWLPTTGGSGILRTGTRVYRRLSRHFQLSGAAILRAPRDAVFATQEDNPPGHARHFLEKRLT
jgi:hypothetical protein